MSLQKEPFRKIDLFARASDVSAEDFQRAFLEVLNRVKNVPIMKRNILRLDIALSRNDANNLILSLNLPPGAPTSFDAIMIAEFESEEKWEEVHADAEFIKARDSTNFDAKIGRMERIIYHEMSLIELWHMSRLFPEVGTKAAGLTGVNHHFRDRRKRIWRRGRIGMTQHYGACHRGDGAWRAVLRAEEACRRPRDTWQKWGNSFGLNWSKTGTNCYIPATTSEPGWQPTRAKQAAAMLGMGALGWCTIGGTADDAGPKVQRGPCLRVSSKGVDGVARSLALPGAQRRRRKPAVTKKRAGSAVLDGERSGKGGDREDMTPRETGRSETIPHVEVHRRLSEQDDEVDMLGCGPLAKNKSSAVDLAVRKPVVRMMVRTVYKTHSHNTPPRATKRCGNPALKDGKKKGHKRPKAQRSSEAQVGWRARRDNSWSDNRDRYLGPSVALQSAIGLVGDEETSSLDEHLGLTVKQPRTSSDVPSAGKKSSHMHQNDAAHGMLPAKRWNTLRID
ncbi:hypothetical protein C8J57DRAFT_1459075, partial [Mycena rebaudengoi]